MKFRRDLIIVSLATFCLTATLFTVIPTRSADDPNWDPWADIKEDGTVDIYDAITLANAFGASGDTPKNVNVMNWPVTNQQTVFYAQTTNASSPYYNASGFGHMHLIWFATGLTGVELIFVRIGGYIYDTEGTDHIGFNHYEIQMTYGDWSGTLDLPIPSEIFSFMIWFASGTVATAYFAFYLTYA